MDTYRQHDSTPVLSQRNPVVEWRGASFGWSKFSLFHHGYQHDNRVRDLQPDDGHMDRSRQPKFEPRRVCNNFAGERRSPYRGRLQQPVSYTHLEILERCMELSSQLGLLHGSYDFVEGPDGSFTFLEINEMGQFLWLEEQLPQLPLLSIFAAFSLDPRPDFRFDQGQWPSHSFPAFLQSEAYPAFQTDCDRVAAANPFWYPE